MLYRFFGRNLTTSELLVNIFSAGTIDNMLPRAQRWEVAYSLLHWLNFALTIKFIFYCCLYIANKYFMRLHPNVSFWWPSYAQVVGDKCVRWLVDSSQNRLTPTELHTYYKFALSSIMDGTMFREHYCFCTRLFHLTYNEGRTFTGCKNNRTEVFRRGFTVPRALLRCLRIGFSSINSGDSNEHYSEAIHACTSRENIGILKFHWAKSCYCLLNRRCSLWHTLLGSH